MERRLFYDLEIRSQRVKGNVDGSDLTPIDERHDIGMRMVVDDTIVEKGGAEIILRQVIEDLRKAYAERG